ncbi:MAG: BatD family protein [candidate division Zixibacteria bacterium]|nr:BatD family protein [candidate division Zixibacteria bacterium]
MARKVGCLVWIFIFIIAGLNSTWAKEITFSASVDKTEVSLDDQITLTIQVSGDIGNIPIPTLPSLKDFDIYSSGRSQNITFINGKLSSFVAFNYILVPKNKGKFIIGPAEIKIDNQTYQTQPINITVTDAQASQAPPTSGEEKPSTQTSRERSSDLFIETVVDKTNSYVGEQITLTFRFYQGVRLFGNPEYSPPDLTGFWVEDLPPQKRYYKTINGKEYFVTETKTALFPTTAGKQTIGSAKLKVAVEDLRNFFDIDPFSLLDRDMLSAFKQGKPKILSTKPIEIEVLSLPEKGKSEGFKGATGKFSFSASLDKNEVEEGQPLNLKLVVSGQGNIMSIAEPESIKLDNFRFYNSGSSKDISKDNYVVGGSRTYDISLIPEKQGKYTIPPLEFSYFDLGSKAYKTLKSQPFLVTILPGKEIQAMTSSQTPEVKFNMKDIRYIKSAEGHLKNEQANLYAKPAFIILNLIPLVALSISLVYRNHQHRLQKDVGYARLRGAHKLAKKRLSVAKKSMNEKDAKIFYSEIAKALLRYVGDKLNRPAFGLTRDEISSELLTKNINQEKINELGGLLDMCDYARFTPNSSLKTQNSCKAEELKKVLTSAEKIIVDLEREYA